MAVVSLTAELPPISRHRSTQLGDICKTRDSDGNNKQEVSQEAEQVFDHVNMNNSLCCQCAAVLMFRGEEAQKTS